MSASILVVADASRGLTGATRELLALARTLADSRSGSVDLLLLGAPAEPLASEASAAGADRLCIASEVAREGYHPEPFAAVALAACKELKPRAVLLGHGSLGLDLAPRLAFGLGARWATQCVGVRFEGETLLCQRNEVGGKVQVQELVAAQAVVTLRPKSVDVPPPRSERQIEFVPLTALPAAQPPAINFIERRRQDGGATEALEQAEVVITGGLGMGSPEAFDQLRKLADALGGTLGASKQAVDRGWIAPDRQVGLTGTTVAPRVYIAVAVSGALQHMAGCQKSKAIVAINKDPEAPIFRFARYGVLANWEDIVPEMIAQLPASAR